MWIPIKPLSNAFVINIGDMLEVIDNKDCSQYSYQIGNGSAAAVEKNNSFVPP
jgi:hypothetical protein